MKTMKNFAAQQLAKKQMNEVKGGAKFFCTCNILGAHENQEILWIQNYYYEEHMIQAIQTHCVDGGSCNQMKA